MHPVQYYPLALEWWATGGALRVSDQTGQTLVTLPLEFMLAGHVSTNAYVSEQVFNTFDEEGVLMTSEGTLLTPEIEARPGKLLFVRNGEHFSSPPQLRSSSVHAVY